MINYNITQTAVKNVKEKPFFIFRSEILIHSGANITKGFFLFIDAVAKKATAFVSGICGIRSSLFCCSIMDEEKNVL